MRRLLKWRTWGLRGTTAAETSLVLVAATLIVPLLLFAGASWLAYDETRQQAEERIARTLDLSAVPLGRGYAEQRHLEWRRLFGLHPSTPIVARAEDWVKRSIGAMLPSLPATGDDLDDLLDQLHVASA